MKCNTCDEEKPESEFFKDGKYTDGSVRLRKQCKQCYKETRMLSIKRKGVKK